MRCPLVLALMCLSAPLLAQPAAHTISPGMKRAQVVASLGEPATARTVGDDTYLFYTNACGRKCGMNDLVILHADSVTDAIFRSPGRHYTGKSSSPNAIAPRSAAKARPAAAGEPMTIKPDSTPRKPARMKPGPPSDTRPSIPLDRPMIKPAPTPKPASKSP